MTGFTKDELKVLHRAVNAKGNDRAGWFRPHRRLTRAAADLVERGYLEWVKDGRGGALYRIKAQRLDGARDPAPPVMAVGAGETDCAALGCCLPQISAEEPFCLRHWARLNENAQAAYRVGALGLDQIIIALGLGEQGMGVRF